MPPLAPSAPHNNFQHRPCMHLIYDLAYLAQCCADISPPNFDLRHGRLHVTGKCAARASASPHSSREHPPHFSAWPRTASPDVCAGNVAMVCRAFSIERGSQGPSVSYSFHPTMLHKRLLSRGVLSNALHVRNLHEQPASGRLCRLL